MYKRKDIMNFLNLLVEELQSKVYGNVYIMETMMIESYKICIMDRDMRYVFDLTDKIHGIHNDEDADELGLYHSNIIACCNGRRATCGGLEWKYL